MKKIITLALVLFLNTISAQVNIDFNTQPFPSDWTMQGGFEISNAEIHPRCQQNALIGSIFEQESMFWIQTASYYYNGGNIEINLTHGIKDLYHALGVSNPFQKPKLFVEYAEGDSETWIEHEEISLDNIDESTTCLSYTSIINASDISGFETVKYRFVYKSPTQTGMIYLLYWSVDSLTIIEQSQNNCPVITGAFNENFDATEPGFGADTSVPECWRFLKNLTIPTWQQGQGYVYQFGEPNSVPHHFRMNNSMDNQGSYILVSPETDNLGNGNYRIRFFAKGNANGYDLIIGSLSNPEDSSSFTPIETKVLTSSYQEYIVDLPLTTDDYFGFKIGGGSSSTIIYIDDIFYEESSPETSTCTDNLGGGLEPSFITVKINDTSFDHNTYNEPTEYYHEYPATSNTTATLVSGQSYDIYTFTSSEAIIGIWIDYNQNDEFEANEFTELVNNMNAQNTTSFTIPTDIVGDFKMRIRSRAYGSSILPTDACTNFGSGETRDYTITVIENSLSVNDFDLLEVKAYPNPVKDILNISSEQEISGIEIFNLLGQRIVDKKINTNTTSIDLSLFPQGNYILKIKSGNNQKTLKVVKQ